MEKTERQINFDNSWVDKNANVLSVSEALGMLSVPFDSDKVAQRTHDKHFFNKDSQYYQKTKEEILAMWESKGAVSRGYGKMLDNYIGTVLEGDETDMDMFKLDNDVDGDERLANLCKSFDDFLSYAEYEKKDMKYVTREKMLYYKVDDFYIRGRFDALFYDEAKNKWIVIDWKSSGTIDKKPTQYTGNLLGPAKIFPDLNWYTYTLQTYLYKAALLTHYLPEGTKEDNVEVYIVNLPGKQIENNECWFDISNAAFAYDKDIIDNIFRFSYKKSELLKKKKNAE